MRPKFPTSDAAAFYLFFHLFFISNTEDTVLDLDLISTSPLHRRTIASPHSVQRSTSKHHRHTIVFPTQPPPPSSASRPAAVFRLTPSRRCSSPPDSAAAPHRRRSPPTNRSSLLSPVALAACRPRRWSARPFRYVLYLERQKEMEDYISKHKKKQNSKEEQADSENLNDYDLKNISESMQSFVKKMSSYQGAEVPESRLVVSLFVLSLSLTQNTKEVVVLCTILD
nr:protein ecdysoneless homolog [Ipomoea batatas]